MRNLIFLAALVFFSLNLQGQTQVDLDAEQWTDADITEFYTGTPEAVEPILLDTKPLFLKEAIAKGFYEIEYPPVARETGIQGVVKIRVHLDEHGTYISAKPVQGIGGGCEKEALFMVQKVIRRGVKPAEKGGVAIPVIFDFPVRFTLQ